MQKLPKLAGFRSQRAKAEVVFIDELDKLTAKTVDAGSLFEAGLVSSPFVTIKLLSRGEIKKVVTVNLPAASDSAIAAIETAGGSFNKVERLKRASGPAKTD
jgi:ribosomal protein L15